MRYAVITAILALGLAGCQIDSVNLDTSSLNSDWKLSQVPNPLQDDLDLANKQIDNLQNQLKEKDGVIADLNARIDEQYPHAPDQGNSRQSMSNGNYNESSRLNTMLFRETTGLRVSFQEKPGSSIPNDQYGFFVSGPTFRSLPSGTQSYGGSMSTSNFMYGTQRMDSDNSWNKAVVNNPDLGYVELNADFDQNVVTLFDGYELDEITHQDGQKQHHHIKLITMLEDDEISINPETGLLSGSATIPKLSPDTLNMMRRHDIGLTVRGSFHGNGEGVSGVFEGDNTEFTAINIYAVKGAFIADKVAE